LTSISPEGSIPDVLTQVIDAVRRRFSVTSEYLKEDGVIEFTLDPNQRETKATFRSLLDELSSYNRSAILRKQADQSLLLLVFVKPPYPKQRMKIPLILFFATIIAVFADGFIRSYGYSDPLTPSVGISGDILFASLYVLALLGILGIHEMGHKVASWVHKMKSSWPYFIPGIPGVLPTFGAVIRAADVPPNRDALFDLGLSGPVAGLAVTFVVSIFAALSAHLIPVSSYPVGTTFGSADYYTSYLLGLLRPGSSGMVWGGALFQLLYFAYSLGFFVTFINLLPAWQLDGGHIANSAVSPRVHQILTFVTVFIMFITGLFLMAFLILLMYSRAPSLRPLDDVSPLSNTRKVIFILTWILAAAIGAFVIYNNPIFSLGLFKL
jgi:membrane-associated protease RseP (regulator of RpoE activity)